ncbi:MAG: 6-phosphogluconolactonase [Candidatus Acidiferrales bacterium]
MKIDSIVSPDLSALNRAALDEIQRQIASAVAVRGRFAIALSGGHTPAKLYALWADQDRDSTPWNQVHLFWGDERYVPLNDPLSNYRMTREALISRVPIPAANVHPFRTELATPADTAADYEAELRRFFGGAPPEFDVQLLGIGPEGHTASLFPGSPALEEKQRWAAAVRVAAIPPDRLTLTPVVLDRGRNTFFLVAGHDKREILEKIRNEPSGRPSEFPAARIQPSGRVIWFLDRAAAE